MQALSILGFSTENSLTFKKLNIDYVYSDPDNISSLDG